MTTLYHGTKEYDEIRDCEDLISGHDGMIHFTFDHKSAAEFAPKVVECYTNIEPDSLPTLPDLRHWNPFDMANEFRKQGIITDDEMANILSHDDANGEASSFDVQETYAVYTRDYDDEYGPPDLRNMLEADAEAWAEDRADDIDVGEVNIAAERLETLNRVEDARESLFGIMRSKGIPGFKYKNRYERAYQGDWSMAVINPNILSKPEPSQKPSSPDFESVTNAVTHYKRDKQDAGYSSHMESSPIGVKQPRAVQRGGRGRIGR